MATAAHVTSRVLNAKLAEKIMGAEQAAALIRSGDQVGMSGWTATELRVADLLELRLANLKCPPGRCQPFQIQPHQQNSLAGRESE